MALSTEQKNAKNAKNELLDTVLRTATLIETFS